MTVEFLSVFLLSTSLKTVPLTDASSLRSECCRGVARHGFNSCHFQFCSVFMSLLSNVGRGTCASGLAFEARPGLMVTQSPGLKTRKMLHRVVLGKLNGINILRRNGKRKGSPSEEAQTSPKPAAAHFL